MYKRIEGTDFAIRGERMIKVLIVDDQELFSDLLSYMLQNNPDIEVVAKAYNGNEAVRNAGIYEPDVVLMDISMPICDGIEAAGQIKELGLKCKVLMLTSSAESEDVTEAIKNGAAGYVLKSISKDRLILAIRSVHAGLEILDQDVKSFAQTLPIHLSKDAKKGRTVCIEGIEIELSERELQIIRMIVDGISAADMAKELFIAEGRLRNIITEIISKLMLNDRTQLAVFALKNKLV